MAPGEEAAWQTAALNRLLEARKKNGRLGGRKSRGGCLTCKIRRVKCDETHPACNRCKSTGRQCDGYAGAAVPKPNKGAPTQALTRTGISHAFGLTSEHDRRAFDFFLSVTAPRLGGPLDKDFWCGYVLQLASAEPLVVDSLLAISTLYEHPQYLMSFRSHQPVKQPDRNRPLTPTERMERAFGPTPIDKHHADALRSYNRAIRAFTQKMDEGKVTPLLALLSCVLFICIEIIRDDVLAAVALFLKGVELMKQLENIETSDQGGSLLSLTKSMFRRLGAIAAAFGHPHPLQVPAGLAITEEQHDVFADMSQARSSLFGCMGEAFAFLRSAAAHEVSPNPQVGNHISDPNAGRIGSEMYEGQQSHDEEEDLFENGKSSIPTPVTVYRSGDGINGFLNADNNPDAQADTRGTSTEKLSRLFRQPCELGTLETPPQLLGPQSYPSQIIGRQRELLLRLERWHDNFRKMRAKGQDSDVEAASSLMMLYHLSFVWITTRLTPAPMVFDQYTDHFEQVLHYAEIYVEAKAAEKAIFTLEVGAVPPLYFVATKCRIPSVRRRALQLLARAPRKECMWGATNTGQLLSRIIAVEEEGMGLTPPEWDGSTPDGSSIDDTMLPCEGKRVHSFDILKNVKAAAFEVRVTRFPEIDGRICKVVQDYLI